MVLTSWSRFGAPADTLPVKLGSAKRKQASSPSKNSSARIADLGSGDWKSTRTKITSQSGARCQPSPLHHEADRPLRAARHAVMAGAARRRLAGVAMGAYPAASQASCEPRCSLASPLTLAPGGPPRLFRKCEISALPPGNSSLEPGGAIDEDSMPMQLAWLPASANVVVGDVVLKANIPESPNVRPNTTVTAMLRISYLPG